tara:strand:- start:599 stop:871 length:273 start_codon:yes stop_codon:yes gene_type:complete
MVNKEMKLEKDDFGIWDNDDGELSIIKEGYTSREIADYILSLQEKLDEIKKLDLSKVKRFTGTKTGDSGEEHNEIVNTLQKIITNHEGEL